VVKALPTLLPALVLLGCGARSGLDADRSGESAFADAGMPAPDASRGARPDAGPPDAGWRTGPCHLIQTGEPFRTITFDEASHAFRAEGLLARRGGPDESLRVVQYGYVDGMRTGVWQDPPIFAAEVDVSTWPPRPVQPQTELTRSMHHPADLIELSNGKLALSWRYDNDGHGPVGIRYRTLNASTWRLDPERFLVEESIRWSRLELVAADTMASVYERDGTTWIGTFTLDGAERAEAVPLWRLVPGRAGPWAPTVSVTSTRAGTLLAVSFFDCDEYESRYCTSRSIVVARVVLGRDGTADLVPVETVSAVDPDAIPVHPHLITDHADHLWLTWWEVVPTPPDDVPVVYDLHAAPLTPAGVLDGPVQRWLTDTEEHVPSSPRVSSGGELGILHVLTRVVEPEPETHHREITLTRRSIESGDVLDELVFTTARTTSGVSAVQFARPRKVIVGYSSYEGDREHGYGALIQYECEEDL
jgi:hypothetical protein